MMYVSGSISKSPQQQQPMPMHHHRVAAAASADAVLAGNCNDASASSTDDDQAAFELSQYTRLGIEHFGAGYKNDPKALEKLSKRINQRVEQDSSGLITFCDKRIRKRRKKHLQQSKGKRKQGNEELGGSRAVGPEIVSSSDLMLGKCLGQGSFSSVFVLEKHLHRPPSAGTGGPRRGRRSKLATGTNQGSLSRRGASMRFDPNSSHSRSNHSTSRHSVASTASAKSRTGRSPTCLRRRIREEYKEVDDGRDGSRRSLLDNSSSQRSRSLSPSVSSRGRSSPNGKRNDDGSRRTRSLSRSLREGIRACFGKKPRNHHHHHHRDSSERFENDEQKENYYRQKIKRSKSNESIFRGGSRSLSCRKRRSRFRRSRSQDETASTPRTSMNTNDHDHDDNNGSLHSCDTLRTVSQSRGGVLWRKDFPDEEIDESCGGANSNLVVKILQPKLMDQPKLFANCAAGLIREGLFLAAIDHPHVLKVHAWTSPDAWMDFTTLLTKEGDLYDGYILVLERLKGGSLKGWLNRWQSEHKEEERARAAAAAAAEAEVERSDHQRLRMQRTLSFSSSSTESASFFPANPSLMASKYRRSLDSQFVATRAAAAAAEEAMAPLSPRFSPKTAFDAAYRNKHNDRVYPYTTRWPKAGLSDRASILLQLSDTVKHLHKHRIMHRDLKPDNLGVTFDDDHNDGGKPKQHHGSPLSLKIFDFDIARLIPEEPAEADLPYKKGRDKRNTSAKSFDADMLSNNNQASNRDSRSVSPFRTSTSLTGDNQVRRKAKGKYRGKRPQGGEATAEAEKTDPPAVPFEIGITADASVEPARRDALFDMTAKMGSPRYMAPEIARGEPYNLRSEVYTVCLLIHEVLTLHKPYDELQPEDHGRLVHFDLPGYRPPVFSEWQWPSELEEILNMGWGGIEERPSIKEVHSVLKRALPKICPGIVKQQQQQPQQPPSRESSSTQRERSSDRAPGGKRSEKGRGNLLYRTPQKSSKHSRKPIRSDALTPTASNSDFSYDDPLKTVE